MQEKIKIIMEKIKHLFIFLILTVKIFKEKFEPLSLCIYTGKMKKKPKPFQLLVKPTSYDCNLRCGYCFYLKTASLYSEAPRHQMNLELLEKMIQEYLSLGFPLSVFIWQGGEPSLSGLDFFEKVVELERKYAHPGQEIGNAFQTNGILIDENWAEFFARNNFLVGLSLDGPEQIHNLYRKTPSGKGSFEQVWKAMERLRKKQVEFNILCMVTRESSERAGELYEFFKSERVRYLQFIPALELEPETKKLAKFSPRPEEYREFLIELFELWWKDRYRISIREFDWLLAPKSLPRPCIFSQTCSRYLVIEHNGDIFPCDFFVRGELLLRNLKEKNALTRAFQQREKSFSPKKNWLSPSCRSCSWLPLCYGGCLREREPKDNPDPKKSIYCYAYQGLFERAKAKLSAG